jgi:hypothetical protein
MVSAIRDGVLDPWLLPGSPATPPRAPARDQAEGGVALLLLITVSRN